VVKDQIVAVLQLGKEQIVPAARLLAFLGLEEGRERGQPLPPEAEQVCGCQRVGDFL
jgi:hypothetical protein